MSEPKSSTPRRRGQSAWDKVRERLEDLAERLFPSPQPEPELVPIPVRRR